VMFFADGGDTEAFVKDLQMELIRRVALTNKTTFVNSQQTFIFA